MSFVNPFAPKARSIDADVERVKALVRDGLGLPEDTGVTVSEIVCRDPACPGLETVILIMPMGEPTRLLRIPGAMGTIEGADILAHASPTNRSQD